MIFVIENKDKTLIKKHLKQVDINEYDKHMEFTFKNRLNIDKLVDFIIEYFFEYVLKRKLGKFIDFGKVISTQDITYIKRNILENEFDEQIVKQYGSLYRINKLDLKSILEKIIQDIEEDNFINEIKENPILNIDGLINFRVEIFRTIANNILNSYIKKYYKEEDYYTFINELRSIKEKNPKANDTITISRKGDGYLVLNSKKQDISDDFFECTIDFDKYINVVLYTDLQFDIIESIIPYILEFSPEKIIYDETIIDNDEKSIVKIIKDLYKDNFIIEKNIN